MAGHRVDRVSEDIKREITAVMLLESAGYLVPPRVTFPPPKIGEKTGRYSGLVGGIILIIVGIRLFISGVILH